MPQKRKRISEAQLLKEVSALSKSDKLEERLDILLDHFSERVLAASNSVKVWDATSDFSDLLPAFDDIDAARAIIDKISKLSERLKKTTKAKGNAS